ncbi:MAG: putative protein-disulfide isomerase [Saprospiraceae bacterium]|jgi:putative protein-disulfide isomerase
MKNFLWITFSIIFTFQLMAQDKTKLIYFADPMCSWCYGFSPELTKIVEQLGDSIEFEMVMGGLRPYNTETMSDLGDFLKEHWLQVNERSSQPFSYDILKDTAIVYDTEPACRAVALMRQLKPDQAFNFFKAIQIAFYKNNKNTNLTSTYLELLDGLGVDKEDFSIAFESEEWKTKVKEDFEYSSSVGVSGFPTLVFQKGENLFLLSNGYTEAEKIMEKISKITLDNNN